MDSAIQMSEERTVRLSSRQAWNSEDTQPCSFKVFLLSEAECIVFAMEDLLLAHDLRSTAESG